VNTPSHVVDLFTDIVGQPRAVEQLRAALANPVHAYLFVGPPGAGKRAAARAFAASLIDGDERTTRLVLAEQHPDLIVV